MWVPGLVRVPMLLSQVGGLGEQYVGQTSAKGSLYRGLWIGNL